MRMRSESRLDAISHSLSRWMLHAAPQKVTRPACVQQTKVFQTPAPRSPTRGMKGRFSVKQPV